MMTKTRRKYTVNDFAYYAGMLAGPPRRERRKLAHNTYVYWANEWVIVVQYHDTDIIRLNHRGRVIVNTGGWDTITTRDRINAFSNLDIRVEDGQWYIGRDSRCWGKKNPPVYLFDRYADFDPDQRKSPTDEYGTALVRRSVHERRVRMEKEAAKKRAKKDREILRRLKKNGAEIMRRGAMEYVFDDWVAVTRVSLRRAALVAVTAEKRNEIADLKRVLDQRLTLCIQRAIEIAELKKAQAAKTQSPLEAISREPRVIDLS
jgi:hypothetical protein